MELKRYTIRKNWLFNLYKYIMKTYREECSIYENSNTKEWGYDKPTFWKK